MTDGIETPYFYLSYARSDPPTGNPDGGSYQALDSVAEPDYADNGLCALLRLRPYHDLYQDVVDRMGAQIVEIAERDPIEPVEPEKVGDIEMAPSAFPASRPLPVFFIQVAAPTTANAPDSREPEAYGDQAADWRPFVAEQELPLAEYARQITERFDFDVRVSAIGRAGDLSGRRPGIMVIDPAFIADEPGRAEFAAAAKLPRWVLPLVVVDRPNDTRTRKLADDVLDMLIEARTLPTETARRAARGVESLDAFLSIVPALVAEAGKQYLKHRNSRVLSPRPVRRPRLGSQMGPDTPAAAQDPYEGRDA